ncbi:phosphoribosylformylglycinamidine cyclo-ligase, partial [Thermococci archaeon]
PPQIFQAIEKFGQVPKEEMFRTFNMGLGMILVVKRGEEDNAIEEISRIGKKAYVIGEVRENMKNKVAITRKATGLNKDIVL